MAVNGDLTVPYRAGSYGARSLENADFLIPAGTYEVELTWSPKFKKLLPILLDVPEREGIRIHMGTKPEHSQGCILVNFQTQMIINALLECVEKRNKDLSIELGLDENPNNEQKLEIYEEQHEQVLIDIREGTTQQA